jgi:hypothetical protein
VKSSPAVTGIRGSVFMIVEELEFAAVELSFSRRRKNEERSKQFIENFKGHFKPKIREILFG